MSRRSGWMASWSTWVAMGGLVLWGLIHVVGGVSLVGADVVDGLETLGPGVADSVPAAPGDATEGLLRFHGLNVALGGVAVLALSIAWWRDRRPWQLDVAVAVAVALDIGLVAFLVVPGRLPAAQGLMGPVLVAIAVIGALPARRVQPAG